MASPLPPGQYGGYPASVPPTGGVYGGSYGMYDNTAGAPAAPSQPVYNTESYYGATNYYGAAQGAGGVPAAPAATAVSYPYGAYGTMESASGAPMNAPTHSGMPYPASTTPPVPQAYAPQQAYADPYAAPAAAAPTASSLDANRPYATPQPGNDRGSFHSAAADPRRHQGAEQPVGQRPTDSGSRTDRYGNEPSSRYNSQLARQPPKRNVQVQYAPSPPRDIRYDDGPVEYNTASSRPPLATLDFTGVDNGNANAKFFRPSTLAVPDKERLLKDSGLPFGAILAPLCQPLHPEEEVPLIQRATPPERCHRCRGYISCHVRLTEMGRKWECPLCGVANDVREENFCNLDSAGRRLDYQSRPEHSVGSVEYDVDAFPEYALRSEDNVVLPTRPLHHLFLIDVSRKAATVFLSDYVEAIRHALRGMAAAAPECRVAFITFATQLHFYDFRHPEIPQLCVPNVDNPFVPLPFTSLCWMEVGTELDRVEAFLDRVVTIANDLGETECVLGAAVQAATLVLAGQHGGRVILCAHTYPQSGIGKITPREQHQLYGTDRERELLRPLSGFWSTTATAAAKQQISFDLFMFSSDYCELVTLSNLCHVTGGRLILLSNFDASVDSAKVHAMMHQLATEEAGYAAILRVRCSSGVRVQRYRGHYLSQNVQDMDLASVTGSSTFYVDFTHEGKLEKNDYAYFQMAMLYTTRSGHRRVRVQSCRLVVANSLTELFRESDMESTLMGVINDSIADAVNKGTKQARQSASNRTVKIMTCYRRFCTATDAPYRLLMPSCLKLFPVFVLCLLKSDALVEGTTVPVDNRIASIFDIVSIPSHKLLSYLYPTLFCANDIASSDSRCGLIDEATGKCILPSHRQLILDNIESSGVYVLCDEQARLVYLWIGRMVEPQVSQFLFGTPDANTVCRANGPSLANFSEPLRNLLYAVMVREDGTRRIVVVHQGESSEEQFFKQLKEEKTDNSMSYDDYLVFVHKAVMHAMA